MRERQIMKRLGGGRGAGGGRGGGREVSPFVELLSCVNVDAMAKTATPHRWCGVYFIDLAIL